MPTVLREAGWRRVELGPRDLAEMVRLVRQHRTGLMEAWHGYFGAQGG